MKKTKKSTKFKRGMIYFIILLAILLLLILLVRHESSSYRSWRGHQNYFKNNLSPKIETWMTPHTILRHFNISQNDLLQTLNVSDTISNLRTPLNQICIKNKMDCPLITDKLNNLVK
jgi:hypothetical protein